MPGEGGFLALLDTLSAGQASMPVAGASVATHALHLSFSLKAFTDWIKGIRDRDHDWEASRAQSTVNDREWQELRRGLAQQPKH